MISVKDRIPTYPGRVKLTPVPGQPDKFDIVRADEPTEVGTLRDRRLSQLTQADIRTLPIAAGNTVAAGSVVDVVSGEVVSKLVPVGDLAVGATIVLKENGVDVEYWVANQGAPSALYDTSCDGTWLIRKKISSTRAWHASAVSDYANSDINSYLNSTFFNQLDEKVRSAVKQVKIPYRVGDTGTTVASGSSGLSCKVFLLSGYEEGWTRTSSLEFPIDGARLTYFIAGDGSEANARRIAYDESGNAATWWMRSPNTGAAGSVWSNLVAGGASAVTPTGARGIRPAFVLDPSFLILPTSVTPPSQAIALQSGTAGQSIDVIFDGVAELSGITAGTQIASAGVQGYAPQDGWLWVRPAWDAPLIPMFGSYVGDGATTRTINFGITPDTVLLSREFGVNTSTAQATMSDLSYYVPQLLRQGQPLGGSVTGRIVLSGSALSVSANASPFNVSGTRYNYVAFRGLPK